MTDPLDTHSDLHSEQGGLKGERPGRARNPVVKVHDLAVDAYTIPWKLEIQL
jgi:hypothetical protein